MTRVIKCHYNLSRRGWCNADGALLPERQYPYVNLWETPCFILGLYNDDVLPIENGGVSFSASLTDRAGFPVAALSQLEMCTAESEEGMLSLAFNLNTEEAVRALGNKSRAPLLLNVFVEYPSSNATINLSAPVTLCLVHKADETPVPMDVSSQYRVNPIDGGTDIWDYGIEQWMRGVLENGVLSYYKAP